MSVFSPSLIKKFPQLAHPPSRRIELLTDNSATGAPIVIVHGMYASAAHMSEWKAAASREGFTPSTFAYPPTASPGEVIDRLAACVQEISQHAPGVVLLGHSFGAVVAVKAALSLCGQQPQAISRVVAVCAPFGGTAWSRASVPLSPTSKIMQALRADSPLLTGLRNQTPDPAASTEFVSFSATSDAVVTESSATLGLAGSSHYVLENESHVSVLVSSAAISRVIQACR